MTDVAVDKSLIVTFSGKTINPLDPDPNDICIEDIAHALANQCRFTGHVRKFYSVAEHSVRVAYWLGAGGMGENGEMCFIGLMHDASEAYLSDIARPVKRQPEINQFWGEIEERMERTISEKFDIPYPFPDAIKRADSILLRSEQRDLMPDLLRFPGDEYVDYVINPWMPDLAEAHFLDTFRQLGG